MRAHELPQTVHRDHQDAAPRHQARLRIWISAMFLVLTSSKGISSVVMARILGVSQKTAWKMGHAIRELMDDRNGEFASRGHRSMISTFTSTLACAAASCCHAASATGSAPRGSPKPCESSAALTEPRSIAGKAVTGLLFLVDKRRHVPLRKCERQMQGFRSPGGLQRFISVFSTCRNLFLPPSRRRSAIANRFHRFQAFNAWREVAGIAA